jgi:CRP/FNR family transcriptional regulator, cyclic AMP receptor protein
MTDDKLMRKKTEEFFSAFKQRSYSKSQILVQAGDAPEFVYYLESGQVRQYDISYRGDEVVVNVFKPGAFFPMSWAINRTPNDYFFETVGEVKLRLAPPDKAVKFLKDNPDVAFDLLSRVYLGTDGLLRRMAHLMGGSARSRLIFELILSSRRYGDESGNGSTELHLKEGDLAARAGMSRETVNREMKKLKDDGLVSVENRKIVIKDMAGLERQLGTGL